MSGTSNVAGLAIFDGDDTLWETQILYDRAKRRFVELLGDLCDDEHAILALLEDIDTRQVATAGYSRSRFPSSLVRTYEALCAWRGVTPDAALAGEVLAVGEAVFNETAALFPDTVRSLSILRERFRLALVTKGDHDVQRLRIQQTGIDHLFDRVYIVPEKDAATYSKVVRDFDWRPDRTWIVGNSVRSDINPGLQLGARCILIVRNTWLYEKADLRSGDVTVVHSLKQAAELMIEGRILTVARP